jgi:hypothetical protein
MGEITWGDIAGSMPGEIMRCKLKSFPFSQGDVVSGKKK